MSCRQRHLGTRKPGPARATDVSDALELELRDFAKGGNGRFSRDSKFHSEQPKLLACFDSLAPRSEADRSLNPRGASDP